MRIAMIMLLAGVAFPALAQDYPKLKAGLWEMERSGNAPADPSSRTTMCLDASVQREMFDMAFGAMNGMCSKHDFRRSGNRMTGDFVCTMGGSTMRSKSTMILDGDHAYRTEVDTTYDPPFMGHARTKMAMSARNVGPCKPGQRPGDMIMPNGQTLNMRDVMNGNKGAHAGRPR